MEKKRPDLTVVVCTGCGHKLLQCVCIDPPDGPPGKGDRSKTVRVFTEDELREVREILVGHRESLVKLTKAKERLDELLRPPSSTDPEEKRSARARSKLGGRGETLA